MKDQFIGSLKVKESVNSEFLIKYIAVVSGRDGKEYLNLILSDSTGDIESRVWHGAKKITGLVKKGDVAFVEGKVNLFQNRKQLIVKHIVKADLSKVDESDFISSSKNHPDQMFDDLVKITEGLSDIYIKELLQSILHEGDIMAKVKKWPAGRTIHHAFRGGLLEHILSCTNLALFLSKQYEVNENYVVAGCILHDLAKIYEIKGDALDAEYTDEGKLVGHLTKGVEIVEKYCSRIEGFPQDLKMHLKHVLLSHHGEYEYGSPKIPQTSEAFLVHLIDLMDSKMNSIKTSVEKDTTAGDWTGFIRHLDRTLYKKPLPFYSEKIKEEGAVKSEKPSPQNSEPRQNLGAMMANFKLKND